MRCWTLNFWKLCEDINVVPLNIFQGVFMVLKILAVTSIMFGLILNCDNWKEIGLSVISPNCVLRMD